MLLPWETRGAWVGELLSGRRWGASLALVLLATVFALSFRIADRRARTRATRASIAEAQRAVAAFRAELGRCPRSLVELLHPPKSGAQYLVDLPTDGWGRALYVRCPSSTSVTGADVISAGPSGSFLVDDNIQ
jgi:type II secretory pathway pseudopilin PulG